MADSDMLTAGNIAKELKVSDAVVKKAIQSLGLKLAAKKGVCNYYAKDSIAQIKAAIKK
jgi:predicted transcriptional regulator